MNIARACRVLAAAALCVLPQSGWSVFDPVNDDTDIFLANPAFSASRPNVLIMVDNTANWSANLGSTGIAKTITSLTSSGGTATATIANHEYSTGNYVRISGATQAGYNVTGPITVIDVNTFTFAVPTGLTSPATGSTITSTRQAMKTVTTLTQSGGTATAIAPGHGFGSGDSITIENASPAGYNVSGATITVVDNDTFTYVVDPALSSPASGPAAGTLPANITATRAAFAKKYDAVRAGLQAFTSGVLTDNFNVGLALFNEQGVANGVYIRYAVRQANSTNKAALRATVDALSRLGDNTNNGAFSMAMAEMYTYYAGITARTGFPAPKRDYAGNTLSPGGSLPACASPDAGNCHAFSSSGSTTYVSPITDPCQKNFIILISNGPSTQNADNDATATYLQTLKGGVAPAQIALSPSGSEGDWSDEWADFMANADCNASKDGVQNVYTYTVDIQPTTQLQEAQHTALLKSIAAKGKGKYFAVNDLSTTDQFTGVLKTIFNEVQAVNSVFASTTLPVSVNVRGTNLNQVYIGVFRPDANKSPRWLGNLKLYRLGLNTANQTLFLADATGAPAENSSTGFITGTARSYWTQASTYWAFRPPEQNGQGGSSDLPDGDLVEKGGAAQQLRLAFPTDQSSRNLYTCVNATSDGPCASGALLSATPFNTTWVSAADLGAFRSYTVDALSSSGDTATLRLGAAPSPTWTAVTDRINLSGASPDNFNVSNCPLTAANNTTFEYQFSLSACGKAQPDSSTAEATSSTSTPHGLQSGDLVSVSTATNTSFNTSSDAVVSRISNTVFRYPRPSVSGTNGAITVTGKKLVSALTSLSGAAVTATATIPGHGYGSVGSTVSLTISGATPAGYNGAVTATVANADAVTYTTPSPVSGGGTGEATSNAHGWLTGETAYIQGVTPSEYNTPSGTTLSVIGSNTFTYTLPGSPVGNGSGTLMRVMRKVKFITHPTSPATDTATVTLYDNHHWPANSTIIIQGTGGVAPAGYDAPCTASSAVVGGVCVVTSGSPWTITNVSAKGWDMTYSAPANPQRLRNAPSCLRAPGETSLPPGFSSCTTMTSDMFAGRPISTLVNAVQATGTIYAAKSVTLTGLSALTTATGSMTVGRPNDGDTTAQNLIINWVRGADNRNDENPSTTPAGSDIRPSVHGDVLHSRPAVINYNRYGDDNDIYAFYGSNDGVFHALKGGTANHTTGPDSTIAPGTERWGFIPREFLGKLKRLREQSPTISAIDQKDYFADGSIGVYVKDARGNGNIASPLNCVPGSCSGFDTTSGIIGDNVHATNGDKAYVFMTMRRGGSLMYGLDVTNPAAPKLLWRRDASDTGTGWGELGMTWSEPRVSRSRASLGNTNNPEDVVLIFGAGYDEAVEDINPCLYQESTLTEIVQKAIGTGTVTYTSTGGCTITSPTGSTTSFSRTKGRGIMVVDAFDGTVIWQAGAGVTTGTSTASNGRTIKKLNVPDMSCAIPSDTTVLDKNRDGFADRIYVGDTCGQVWRVDVGNASMDQWTVTKIAAFNSTTATDSANKRKFLFPPDLVFGTDGSGSYTAVLLGSGDREHPFDTVVVNRFYMIKDRDGSSGTPTDGATNSSSVKIAGFSPAPTGSVLTDSGVFDATNAALIDGADAQGLNGWKITLAGGEKVVSSATSVAGTVFFNTNQPSSTAGGGSCGSNLGIAREYLVGFADAAATIDLNATGGITISDRSTIHAGGGYLPSPVPVVVEIDGKKYQAVISGTSVQTPPGLTLEKRTRQYWYKEID